jgi:hypothetical protein
MDQRNSIASARGPSSEIVNERDWSIVHVPNFNLNLVLVEVETDQSPPRVCQYPIVSWGHVQTGNVESDQDTGAIPYSPMVRKASNCLYFVLDKTTGRVLGDEEEFDSIQSLVVAQAGRSGGSK